MLTDFRTVEMATEEVLLAHEMEKNRLIQEHEHKAPVLAKLTKYFELLDEMAQLEVSTRLFCIIIVHSLRC